MSICVAEDVSVAARSLSSGTMATLMQESGLFYLYQCRDCWWADQVQSRFALFAGLGEYDRWQDAWHEYVRWVSHVHDHCWKVSYAGSFDYQIEGDTYEKRSFATKSGPWNTGVFEGFHSTTGCIYRHYGMGDHPVPDKVIAAFPGYVPVSATFDKEPDPDSCLGWHVANWQYVYDERFGENEFALQANGDLRARGMIDYDQVDWENEPRRQKLLGRLGQIS